MKSRRNMEAKNQTKNKSKGHTKRKRHKCIVPINYIQEKTGQQQTRGRKRKRRKWQITNRDVETAVNTEEEEETKSRQAQKGEEKGSEAEAWKLRETSPERTEEWGWQRLAKCAPRDELSDIANGKTKHLFFSRAIFKSSGWRAR